MGLKAPQKTHLSWRPIHLPIRWCFTYSSKSGRGAKRVEIGGAPRNSAPSYVLTQVLSRGPNFAPLFRERGIRVETLQETVGDAATTFCFCLDFLEGRGLAGTACQSQSY